MALTTRETKNKILADMPEGERHNTVATQGPRGSWFLISEKRVFEIYESGDTVYASVRDLASKGWEDFEV